MAGNYDVLRRLEGGELLRVASRSELAEARQLAESLNFYWPAEYIVRESAPDGESGLKQERPADRPQGVHKSEFVM
jgi:hypothetical protein